MLGFLLEQRLEAQFPQRWKHLRSACSPGRRPPGWLLGVTVWDSETLDLDVGGAMVDLAEKGLYIYDALPKADPEYMI